MPLADIPFGKQKLSVFCLRFNRRPVHIMNTDAARQVIRDKLEDVGKNIEFGIISGLAASGSGYPTGGYSLGVTYAKEIWRKAKCSIAYEIIEPLLDARITISEKQLARFNIAVTVVHELTVSQLHLCLYFVQGFQKLLTYFKLACIVV